MFVEGFTAASTASGTTLITVTSSEEEPKTLKSIKILDIDTNAVYLDGYLERELVISKLYLPVAADKNPPLDIPIEVNIPAGQSFVLKCFPVSAGSHGTPWGYVEYEIGAGR